jgi:phospholipase C
MNPQQQPGDPVRHVVLLLFENRSFDQMLGCLKRVYPDLAGDQGSRFLGAVGHEAPGEISGLGLSSKGGEVTQTCTFPAPFPYAPGRPASRRR